jgi:PIN domain nuclease of toxin-antitoxin system
VRLLLDTHVLIWWLGGDERLRRKTRNLLSSPDHELLWSAASTWELAIKIRLGRFRLEEPLQQFVLRVISSQGLTPLPVDHAHAARVADLPQHHRDPFDRLLVAQAMVEGVTLLTADPRLSAYDIEILAA